MANYFYRIGQSAKAFAESYIEQTPVKWYRLQSHCRKIKPTPTNKRLSWTDASTVPYAVAKQEQNVNKGFYKAMTWTGRLVHKVLDLLGVPEFFDLIGQIIKPNTRMLTELEVKEAKKVFGGSLPYHKIRIDEYSLIAMAGAKFVRTNDMGVGLFYTIHFTRPLNIVPGNCDMKWLIHELVHVAQMLYVGSQYTSEALYAQFTTGYDYGGPNNLINKQLKDFNREQQGCIPEDYYYFVLFDRNHKRYGYMPYRVYKSYIQQLQEGDM
jgi:hypothetical protein